ncbi:hypothetical protein EON81_17040 [bacterium]|nr:MAG: hypothetical protein EON81_17040 [bacterium]
MTARFLRTLFFFTLLAVAATMRGQMIPPDTIETLDVRILNAKSVVIGSVTEVKPTEQKDNGYQDIAFKVKETLKGERLETVNFTVWARGEGLAVWNQWQAQKTPLLLDLRSTAPQIFGPRVIPLDAPTLVTVGYDLKPLKGPDALIRYVREVVRKNPGVTHVEDFTLDLPDGPAKAEIRKKFGRPRLEGFVVPVDGRIEKQALQQIRSKDVRARAKGVRTLHFFKTPKNIALLKSLLTDTSYTTGASPSDRNGIEERNLIVREAAFDTLTRYWHINVLQPELREQVSLLAKIPHLRFNGPVAPDAIEAVRGAKQLQILEFYIYQQTGPDVAPEPMIEAIAQSEKLTTLIIPQKGVRDATLLRLQGLPNLQKLILDGNPITDAGLKTIEAMKHLKEVSLGQTEVTDEGLAALRKARPDLRVSPAKTTSPLRLYVTRNDIASVRAFLDRNPNAVNSEGVFHSASYFQYYDLLKLMLERGASPEVGNEQNYSALQSAMGLYDVSLQVVALLIAHGADVNRPWPKDGVMPLPGVTPLLRAFQHSNPTMMRLLFASGADPGTAGKDKLGLARPREDAYALMESFQALKANPVPIVGQTGALCNRVVYSLDPPDGTLGNWTTRISGPLNGPLAWSKTPSGRPLVGSMGQQSANLKLSDLPAHRNVRVEIDLFIMGSWDGNGGLVPSPDIFDITVPGSGTLLHTTFFNNNEDDAAGLPMQSFPASYPFGFNLAYTGATEVRNLGHTQVWQGREYRRDAVYKLVFTFAHSDPNLELVLNNLSVAEGEGTLAESESWGIGGLVVKTDG